QLRNSDADSVILGCTHYPLLYQPIYEYFSGTKPVISSGLETARELSALLTFSNEHASFTVDPQHSFFATGDTTHIKNIIDEWLNMTVEVQRITVYDS
ncbi:aspartate/glutamate racemase family protein, partial [Enterobacter hormaechei]|nr:aspartate/glutamate racemase family protein [Enterobacter hormaechei]